MSRFFMLLSLCVLLAGCGKKPKPAPEPEVVVEPGKDSPEPEEPSDRDLWLADLKGTHRERRKEAVEALATMAESDAATREALIELLRDKTTAGAGKTHPTQISSTREAATLALLRAGPKGEATIVEKGLTPLREGLSDKDPAIREHTAHVLGLIGPAAKPLSNQLLRVAADDKVEQVRAIAFDALRTVGVADVSGLAALLNRKDPPDVKRRAAEIISVLPEIPPFAVSSLCRALEDEDDVIRVSAAIAIDTAGAKGASKEAPTYLVAAIQKNFPPMFDPMSYRSDDPQYIYFTALGKQGKLAVQPTLALLKHKNELVRFFALRTLGDIGKDAKEAAPALRDLFTDPEVVLEAIVTLHRVGEEDLDAGIRLLETGFASPMPQVVQASIETVSRLGPAGKKLVPAALAQLRSSAPLARYAAVGFVGTLSSAEAAKQVPALAKLAADPEPLIRRRVGSVLEKLGPAAAPAAEAVGTVLKQEKDEAIREQYVDALLAMGPAAKPAVVGLAPLLADANASLMLKLKVIDALVQADPASAEAATALVKAAGDRDALVRKEAAGALGKLNPLPDDARSTLVKLLKTDPNGSVQMAAARGLALAGPRAAAVKPELEAAATSKLPASAFWAKVALAGVNGDVKQATGLIRDSLKDRNGLVRAAAADALTLVGPSVEDVPALVKISREPAPGASVAAAQAIGMVGAPAKDAVPRLIELVAMPDTATRIAAAEALAQIGLPAAAPAIPKIKDAMRADPAFAVTARRTLEKLGVRDEPLK